MLDMAEELNHRLEEGREFVLAGVVGVSGGAGAALAVDREGIAIGSVSGGCVEGAVQDLCTQALEDGGTVVERFGYHDEDASAVGLTCGGVIYVLVRAVFRSALAGTVRGEPAALARVIRGPPNS